MENSKSTKEYYVIDVLHIVKSVWHRAWAIALCAILAAGIGFSVAAFAITPTYSSSIMIYVNNKSASFDDIGVSLSLSSSDLSAAQSLVKTYSVLLKNRTILGEVIDQSELGDKYTWKQLDKMIQVSSVNETEVMQVTVTSEDPYEAQRIANAISIVMVEDVAPIISNTSIEVVDTAEANKEKVAPSVTRYTAIGGILGVAVALVILVALAMMDNTIHDEEYILRTYDYPILAKIPDLLSSGNKRYGYGYHYYKKNSKEG